MKFTMNRLVFLSLVIVLVGITYLSLSPQPKVVASNDKLGHFIAYGTLMLNLGVLYAHHRIKLTYAAVFAFLYGGLMEFGQYFVPGRSVSGLDLLANTGGVLIGFTLSFIAGKAMRKLLHLK